MPRADGVNQLLRSRRALAIVTAAAAVVVFALVRSQLTDDTYITLAYARNLATSLHWGLIPGATSNTATSPLNVIALAAITFVVRQPVVACGILFVLSTVGLAAALHRLGEIAGLPRWFAAVAVGLVLVNPLLVSSIGLEVALGAAGVAFLLLFAAEQRPWACGVVAGILLLIRLDLVVFVAAVLLLRRWPKGWWRSAVAAAAVAGPWFVWSWVVLGSAVPDTLIIKLSQKSWNQWTFTNGPFLYLERYWGATVASFAVGVLGLVAVLVWASLRIRRPSPSLRRLDVFAPFGLGASLHYAAYAKLSVPPYHWYYGPSVVGLTVFFTAAVAATIVAPRTELLRLVAAAGVTVAVVFGGVAAAVDIAGIARRHPPITTNHASPGDYADIGHDLKRRVGSHTVQTAGEIGGLAYFCNCAVVDAFSDRGEVRSMIEDRRRASGAIGRFLIDVNFHFLSGPVGPRKRDFRLVRMGDDAPPGALESWPIQSPWTGSQRVYLLPG